MVNYIYESGEQVATGSHGEHNYLYASGEPVPDSGQSSYVFESGVGLGGEYLHRWKMNDSGGPIEDSAGNLDGTVINSPTFQQPGKENYAIDFSGDGINVSGFTVDSFTVAVWCYQDTTDQVEQVWEYHPDGGGEMRVETKNGGMEHYFNGTQFIIPQNSNEWERHVSTYDASTGEVAAYRNGVQEATGTATDVAATDVTLYIAYDADQNYQYWDGRLDDMKVWDRALSATEVQDEYNSY